jgi:N-acyl-D-aspartate/D-glutamate deacylase
MTSLPAARLGLTHRGRIAPGCFADVTVFNAGTVQDRATFAAPHQYSTGVEHVLVNGVLVVDGGRSTAAPAGRAIRSVTD